MDQPTTGHEGVQNYGSTLLLTHSHTQQHHSALYTKAKKNIVVKYKNIIIGIFSYNTRYRLITKFEELYLQLYPECIFLKFIFR